MANDWGDEAANDWGDKPERPAASQPPRTGRAAVVGEEAPGFLRGVARGGWAIPGLAGLDYETAVGLENSLRDPSKLSDRGMGVRERFAFYRDMERERSRRGEDEHPVRTGLGIGAGSAPSIALLPQAKAAEGAGIAARAGASALTGAAQSAAVEGGVTGELPVKERLERMGAAGVAGGALGGLAPAPSGAPTQPQIDRSAGIPKGSTSSAVRLMDEGVPLTPGQRNPAGKWNQIEEASTSLPLVGSKIKEIRDNARDVWARKAFEKGRAPGAPSPDGSTPGEQIAALRKGYSEAYSSVKGAMDPQSVAGLPDTFASAAKKSDALATDATRKEVGRFLTDQLSLLDREAPTVEKLLAIRSNIREAKRSASPEAIPLLRDAEQAATKAITDGAPPEAVERLSQLDRRYGDFKTLGRASRKAGDQPTGMTPTHLSNAVREGTPDAVYSAGGGGPLRDWAAAGKEAFDTKSPATGARLLTLIPGARYPLGAAAYLRASNSATTVQRLTSALKTNPQAFGDAAPKLLAAAERGPEALAAAHYVLSMNPGSDYRARAARVLDGSPDRLASEGTP